MLLRARHQLEFALQRVGANLFEPLQPGTLSATSNRLSPRSGRPGCGSKQILGDRALDHLVVKIWWQKDPLKGSWGVAVRCVSDRTSRGEAARQCRMGD